MEPFPLTKVSNLLPIFDAMVKEGNLSARSSKEHCMAKLMWGYSTKGMSAYVDDTDKPKHVIIFGKFPGIVTNEMLGIVLFIYSVPEERGTPESLAAFEEQINAYAAQENVNAVIMSDWQWGGCQLGAGVFARRMGFQRQEVVYAKVLSSAVPPAILEPPK